jgi:ATP-dependent DNA helicase RecG
MLKLSDNLSDLPKVGPFLTRKFEKLGVKTIENLFYHIPSHYIDYSQIKKISELHPGETVTIHAKIISLKNIYSKRGLKMQIGSVEDLSEAPGNQRGKITVIWFNQPFLIKTLYPGKLVSLSGKVGFFNRKLCLTSPDYEILSDEKTHTLHTGRLVPIYPETAGLSSKWIRRTILNAYNLVSPNLEDFLPKDVLKKYQLEGLKEAFEYVHFPKNLADVETGKKRLAFNELLNLQLKSGIRRINWQKSKTPSKLKIDRKRIDLFIRSLPFKLTASQKTAIDEILKDMGREIPMNRLLEGDVGSGKTVVAATATFAAFLNGYQTVIMAPTQILATQHYETLKKLLSPFNIRISLITSNIKKSDLGRNDIFVGTHALLQKSIIFDNVALVVIDEQHRFGVEQRALLAKKSAVSTGRQGTPHVLTMTATPIPRTVALTTYGDLDLSILTEMPKGRTKVTTWVVPEEKREGAYEWIKSQVSNHKSQVFIVCPLIEDSESETLADVKSVTSEFKNLQSIFSNFRLGLLHGRLKSREKEKILNDFRERKTDILVTTPVVEVGIDIPNATIIVIEAAERFGLAQLHQLRGRVGRGVKKSYCLLFSNIKYSRRLKAMEKSHSGFELAELDLKLRGPGEIFGTAQSGFPELKVASWGNYELIKNAKDVAEDIIKNPKKFPLISKKIEETYGY